MTATTIPESTAAARTWRVVRMQLINRQTFIWVPLIILVGSFLLSLAVFALIPFDGPKYGGASQAPLWYFFAVGIQALTLSFPFSQAMSVTRRAFFLGTLLTAAITSAILGIVFVVGGILEDLTNGWGVNGYYFRLDWVWQESPAVAGLLYFTTAMLLFLVGFAGATIHKRFGVTAVAIAGIAAAVLAVAAIALLTWTDSWATAWNAVASQGPLVLTLWIALVAAVLAVVSWLVLRRATP